MSHVFHIASSMISITYATQGPKHYLFSSLLMKLLFLCEYSPLFRVTRVIEGGKFAGPGDLDVLLKVLLRGH